MYSVADFARIMVNQGEFNEGSPGRLLRNLSPPPPRDKIEPFEKGWSRLDDDTRTMEK